MVDGRQVTASTPHYALVRSAQLAGRAAEVRVLRLKERRVNGENNNSRDTNFGMILIYLIMIQTNH